MSFIDKIERFRWSYVAKLFRDKRNEQLYKVLEENREFYETTGNLEKEKFTEDSKNKVNQYRDYTAILSESE